MQKQEINTHEASKAIAEYMSYKLVKPEMRRRPENFKHSYWETNNPHLERVIASEHKLKYHSSWDWLMPVAKKVTDELDNTMKPDKIPGGVLNDAQFKLRQECNRVANRVRIAASEFDLPALFRAVHEAVLWINANKKKI